MMEANQNSSSVTTELINDLAAAVLLVDLCVGCNGDLEDQKMVLVKLPVQRGDRTYPYLCLNCCGKCAVAANYNRLKKGLNYWLNEGKLEVLKDEDI